MTYISSKVLGKKCVDVPSLAKTPFVERVGRRFKSEGKFISEYKLG